MNAGVELQCWNCGGIDVDQTNDRIISHDVAAAFHAVLTAASFRLHKAGDGFRALRYRHVFRLPQRKALTGAADQERQELQWQ